MRLHGLDHLHVRLKRKEIMKIAVTIAALLALTACSNTHPPTPEEKFLKDVHAALDGKVLLYDEKLITAGRLACQVIPTPGVTHSRIVAAGAEGLNKNNIPDPFGASEVIVSAAEHDLCPTIRYAVDDQNSNPR